MSTEEPVSLDQLKNEVSPGIESSDVVTKYRTAADIANEAMGVVVAALAVGSKIVDVCNTGDNFITERCSKVYRGKGKARVEKGIAFPTCVSVNDVAGHFSPLSTHEAAVNAGDVVKIELGVHIDGYCVNIAKTVLLEGEESTAPVTGPVADLMHATNTAMEACLRTLKVGNKNTDVTDMLQRIAGIYDVNVMASVTSHNLSRFDIDGDKTIVSKKDPNVRNEVCTFEVNEVYALDIMLTTGSGSAKEMNEKTTVYKRVPDVRYKLKMKASKYVYGEIVEKFSVFPFTLRALDDQNRARLGVTECVAHNVVEAYPVFVDKDGGIVSQMKATVLLMPSGTTRITGAPLDLTRFQTDKKIEDQDLIELLAQPIKKEKKKKNKQ